MALLDQCISGHYLSILKCVSNILVCSVFSMSITPVQPTCRYFEHLHVGTICMSLMFRKPVNLILVGYMTTDERCAHALFKVHKLATSTKVSVHAIPCNYFEIGYNWKHTLISNELYLHVLQMHCSQFYNWLAS